MKKYDPQHPVWGDRKCSDQIEDALKLLDSYDWSPDLVRLKPVLQTILKSNDATSIVLATILEREC